MTGVPYPPPPPATHGPPDNPGRQPTFAQSVGLLLLVVVVVFIAVNTKSVEIEWLFAKPKMPLAIALLGAALLGALGMALLLWRRRRR